jgi:hypothetical protein
MRLATIDALLLSSHPDEDALDALDVALDVALDEALDDALVELRRSFLARSATSGRWLEVLHLVGPRIVEHVVVAPGGRAIVAGVRVSDRVFVQGEALVIPVATSEGRGELLVRFVPSPARLLPTDPSRLALVMLLVAACLASVGAHRTAEPAAATRATQLERTDVNASARRRGRVRAPAYASERRRRAVRSRIRRVVRTTRTRAVRVTRRAVPRRTAPEPDPGDPDDPNDRSRPSRPLRAPPETRARGPPASPCTHSCTRSSTWRKTCSLFSCS